MDKKKLLKQSNNFIVYMNQLMNNNEPLTNLLYKAQFNLEDPLKTDVLLLANKARNDGGSSKEVQDFCTHLTKKYAEEFYLDQYIQQLSNAFASGHLNRDACENLGFLVEAKFNGQKEQVAKRHKNQKKQNTRATIAISAVSAALSVAGGLLVAKIIRDHNK